MELIFMKTIGVLTSGGDAPGMNAAVRAVVRTAVYNGITVKGIRRGYNGLMEGDIIDLDSRAVSGIIQLGGTMLYSARSPRFKTQEGVAEAVENCKKHGIEGIVVIGGDGSFRGARDLSLAGIPCVGIPATIDNDISSTEYTIGFDTAMNTVIEMVDRLRDTCDSHERCSVVEVMGRHAGHIALRTAIGVGALAVMVPERKYDLDAVIEKIKETQRMGKKHFIVMVAEGVGGVTEMAKKIEEATGIETRGTILGHVQRGGSPTLRDRLIATQMGFEAVQLLKAGIGNRVVAYRLGKVVDYDIYEALNMKKGLEDNLCLLADITAI
jgi:6-phosphofructokinase 1